MAEDQVRLWKKLMRVDDGVHRYYKDLGLVNTRRMFENAVKERYAVPGYNFYDLEQLRGIMYGCVESNSPVILQVLERNLVRDNLRCLPSVVKGIITAFNEAGRKIPIALHLDHGTSLEVCKKCVDVGFSSVMIDGSMLPYHSNVKLATSVADYAHKYDVCVEGELGGIAGATERGTSEEMFTRPREVEDFVKETGIDSLAISIGTAHGPYKSKSEGTPLQLKFDILDDVRDRLPRFPLVLHGASSVPKQYVDILRKYGATVEGAAGVPDEQLRTAVRKGICKANFDTDIKLIFTAVARQYVADHPNELDPKNYLDIAETKLKEYVMQKNQVLSSADRAKTLLG